MPTGQTNRKGPAAKGAAPNGTTTEPTPEELGAKNEMVEHLADWLATPGAKGTRDFLAFARDFVQRLGGGSD